MANQDRDMERIARIEISTQTAAKAGPTRRVLPGNSPRRPVNRKGTNKPRIG